MICINCFHEKTKVTNSRQHKKHPSVWRRRTCERCQTTFTTKELPSAENLQVLQRDKISSPFSLGKLIISIGHSFQHNKQLADEHSYDLALTVQEILVTQVRHPSVDEVSVITHGVLKRFDQMAALQYAAQHDLITHRKRPGRPAISYSDDEISSGRPL